MFIQVKLDQLAEKLLSVKVLFLRIVAMEGG